MAKLVDSLIAAIARRGLVRLRFHRLFNLLPLFHWVEVYHNSQTGKREEETSKVIQVGLEQGHDKESSHYNQPKHEHSLPTQLPDAD